MAKLAGLAITLKDVTDRVAELEGKYTAAVAKEAELARKVEQCSVRLGCAKSPHMSTRMSARIGRHVYAQVKLGRAEKLIGGLAGERERWEKTVEVA